MHALVPSVLLWASWLDALERDAEPQPPDRERGEPKERPATGEGYPVICPDRFGQAVFAKESLEDGDGVLSSGVAERLTADEIATREVDDGERIAVAAIGEHELALVVGAPEVVGFSGD